MDLIANDTTMLYVSLAGLYTDYVSENEYTRIDINYIELTKDSVLISEPSSLSGYMDISDIDELVNGILTTGSNKDYAISGTVTLGLPVISDIDVPVDRDGDGVCEGVGKRLQFKELLGVGFTYKF